MKKILFPTDFSEVATNAFVYALEFAKIVQGELIVLHSYDLIPMDNQFFPENFTELYDSIELANFDLFKEEIPKIRGIMEKHNLRHIKLTHRLMEGDLFVNIKKSIEENKIDYVIMGTSGDAWWEALFAGSNSGSVILGLDVPMFCIPLGVKFKKIKTIGYINHYRAKDKEVLYDVLDFAKRTKAIIKCLYVKTSNSDVDIETIKKWEDEFSPEPVSFFVIQSDEIKHVMLDFISNQEIGVLTMLTYKSSFFEGMFVPNYFKNKVTDTDIPIMVIHA
ncbi:universal stress protein [Flavobacterium sp.]|uniref:universal stress protein n=1 Tax=Flavobacterium sp. TaxID=239 RepID=UPI0038FC30D9